MQKQTRVVNTFDVTALFRRTSRAVEYQTLKGVTAAQIDAMYSDPALIRMEITGAQKKEVFVETERISLSATKTKVKRAKAQ